MLAFLPHYQPPAIPLGPLSLQPFGILVAIGVLVGAWIGRERGKRLGIDENDVRLWTGYLLVGGFLGAHLFDVFFYQFDEIADDPLLLVKIWDGISSYGGILGACAAFLVYWKVHKVERPLVYADLTMWGFLPGFTFGRLGCTIVFDHPGSHSELWSAMPFPNMRHPSIQPGEMVHNLGFYEFVFLLGVIASAVIITRAGRARPVGFIAGYVCILYGPVRFYLDFLRYESSDPTYFGLTFAQYVSIATFLTGVALMYRAYTGPKWDPEKAFEARADRESAKNEKKLAAQAGDKKPATSSKKSGGSGKKSGGSGPSKKKQKKKGKKK